MSITSTPVIPAAPAQWFAHEPDEFGRPIGGEARLIECVHRHTGTILQTHQFPALRKAFREAAAIFQLRGTADFCERMDTGASAAPAMEHLISKITIGESYFDRVPEQWTFLRDIWLPRLIERKRQADHLTLRIWSAGCSGGEEIYTMAMLLRESLPDIANWRITLLGTDINPVVLELAREGLFRPWSLRTMNEARVSRYFKRVDARYALAPEIRRMARFSKLNLASGDYPSLSNDTFAMDLILCRNVFIYLGADTVAAIMQRFGDALAPNGGVLLAPADFMEQRYGGLHLVQHEGVSIFMHGEPDAGERITRSLIAAPVAIHPVPPLSVPAISVPPDAAALPLSHEPGTARQTPLAAAEQSITAAPEHPAGYLQRAAALAGSGLHAQALTDCDHAIALNDLSPDAHYLRGQLMLNARDHNEARACFQRVLFLDWQRPECHFRLGVMAAASGDKTRANKHMKDALKSAAARPADDLLPGGETLTYGQLTAILRVEIDRRSGPTQPRGATDERRRTWTTHA